MERTAKDVRSLLLDGDDSIDELDEVSFDTMFLWDECSPAVRFGVSYGREFDMSITAEVENNGSLVGV